MTLSVHFGLQVHYLGSPGRGTVWEEVIIHCPTTIQMLAMSATVANPEDLGAWIRKVGWGNYHCTQAAGHAKKDFIKRHVRLLWQQQSAAC